MHLRPLLAGIGLALVVALPCLARAGSVSGKLAIDTTALGEAPVQSRGFLDRIPNPLTPVKRFDPMPFMIVVLEGAGDAAPNQPMQVRYDIIGESFERPVLPVLINTDVEVRNTGRGAPVLVAPGNPALLPAEPLNPGASRTFKTAAAAAGSVILLRDQQSPHLVGRVVVLPHRFFATVDAAGKFELPDVPAGRWTVRVWYRDGWLERTDETIDVGKGKIAVEPRIPAKLEIEKADK
jgi:hypothetical protein